MTTFFIEHGVGNSVNTVISRFQELPSVKKRIIYYVKKLMFKFFRVYRNRMFFLSAAKYLDKSDRSKYIKLFFYYKKFTPIHALSLLKFRERTPHFAILFNRNNIEPFLLYNEIEQSNVFTLGVPFYDKYVRRETVQKSHIVFIEHPYLESHLLDWDDAFHENVARTIENFAIKKQIKIIVKLHPSSDIQNWLRYNLDPLVVIKQREDVTDEMLNARLILGYSSTLINVLIAAKKNVVLLGWHPEPKIFGDDVSRTGLCHVSFEASELIARYDYWIANNLAINNTTALEEFIEEYNHPFDGKATKRVIDTILQNEVS